MKFSIYTLIDNGSGMKYTTKAGFLAEISAMIDDCIANGGTYFSVEVDTDASCFCNDETECDDEVLHLEIADLLEYDEATGDCKVSKDIFDDYVRNAWVQIHFEEHPDNDIRNYFMASEDEDGIFMKSIEE